MPKQGHCSESSNPEPGAADPGERRKDRVPRDWESIALLRVASRLQSLTAPGSATAHGRTVPRYGWEEAILRNLSQRLKDFGSR